MKKFLTVLLVIAVMFTFSFGSTIAWAATGSAWDEGLAEKYLNIALDDVKDSGVTVGSGETTYHIDYDTLMANYDQLWKEVKDAQKSMDEKTYWVGYETVSVEDFLNGKNASEAPEVDVTKYDVTKDLVKAQFAIDKQEALDILNALSTADYSSKEMSKSLKTAIDAVEAFKDTDNCKTYEEHVKHLISNAVDEVNDADDDRSDDSLAAYAEAYGKIYGTSSNAGYIGKVTDKGIGEEPLVIEDSYVGSENKLVGLGVYKLNPDYVVCQISASDVELKTFKATYVDGDDAVSDANIAAAKSVIATAYANYVRNDDADLDYAKDAKAILDYLAEQEIIDKDYGFDGKDSVAVFAVGTTSKDDGALKYRSAARTAIEAIETFEASANALANEKDSTGAIVRDAEKVADAIDEAKIVTYADVFGITQTDYTMDIDKALDYINGLYVSLDSEKLAYGKKMRETLVSEFLADCEGNTTYYAKELQEVKDVTAEYLTKVNAVTDLDDIAKYDVDYFGGTKGNLADVTYKKADSIGGNVGKIKTASEVDELALNSNLFKGTSNVSGSALEYAGLINDAISKSGSRYYLGTAGSSTDETNASEYATLTGAVCDLVGASDARTTSKINDLSNQLVAMIQTLPTVDAVDAAKDAADDAIDALPTGTVKISDKEVIDAAIKAVDAYDDLTNGSYAEENSTEYGKLTGVVVKYAYAFRNEMDAKAKAVSTTDKAANDALVDEIDAFIDAYEDYTGNVKLEGASGIFRTDATGTPYSTTDLRKIDTNLDNIKSAAKTAVKNAIAAIPVSANLTQASKATVENARKLFDEYVATYTEYDDYDCKCDKTDGTDGFVQDDFDYATLAKAETSLGMNYDPVENAKAYVQDLKIVARSAKTSKGVKVTINANVQSLLDDGFTVEYKFYRSTKSNKNFGTAKIVKTENTYLNTSGTKGTKYYYKAKLVVKNAAGEVVATTPLTQCLYACRTF